jgi:hypothetical protein
MVDLGINSQNVETTVGAASGIRHNPSFSVTDAGETIDLSTLNLNNNAKHSRHFIILNVGDNDVRVQFDVDGDSIVYADPAFTSWNLELKDKNTTPNSFTADANATKIGFRCDTGLSTTINILIA